MGHADNTSNGMSYDFGIQIAKGTVSALASTVAGVIALTGSIAALVDSTNMMEKRINANQIAFGGYANTMKAVEFAQRQVMKNGKFTTDDMIAGFRELSHAGLDARKEFDLIAKAAAGSGKEFNDIARIIRNGDYGGLAEMGIITDRMAHRMQEMGYTQQQNVNNVLRLLKQADTRKMFDGAVESLESLKRRIAAYKGLFVQAIVGDPKDPMGLAYTFKQHLTSIANFLDRNKNAIIYYGRVVGLVLRTALNIVGDFIKYIAKTVFHVDKYTTKTTQRLQDQLMSFGLWLEIQRVRIKIFFEEYGKYIGWIIKAILIYKGLQFGHGLWVRGLAGAKKLFNYLHMTGLTVMQKIFDGLGSVVRFFRVLVPQAWAFTTAMLANPIGLIVIAVIALIAALVVVVKYWDEIYNYMQGVSDGAIALIGYFMPVVGIVLLIAKYWEEIKAIIYNVGITAYNWIDTMWMKLKSFWIDVKKVFKDIGAWLYDNLIKPFEGVFQAIGDFITEWITGPIGRLFDKIGDFFSGLFGKAVDKTKEIAENSVEGRKKAATELYMKGGMTGEEYRQKMTDIMTQSKPMSNADVQAKKQQIKVDYDKKKEQEKLKEKTSSSVLSDMSAWEKKSASSVPSGGDLGMTSTSIDVKPGAIQINLPAGSNIDEAKLAKLIEKTLREMNNKKQLREGN